MSETFLCPHCSGQVLFEGARGTVSLHGCGLCGGLWIGNELAGRLMKQLVPDALTLADLASRNAGPFPEMAAQPACPVCRKALRRTTFGASKIELDLCDAHGTWFDRDELQSVVRFLEEQRRAAREATPFPPPMRFDPAQYNDTSTYAAGAVALFGAGGTVATDAGNEVAGDLVEALVSAIFR